MNGGDINVKGGPWAAGIGGGMQGNGGTITINGGKVTAQGGISGGTVGIGGGGTFADDQKGGNGGTITINGGIVSASGHTQDSLDPGYGMGGGKNAYNIGTVSLNWKNPTDRIYADSYNSDVTLSGNFILEGTDIPATTDNIGGQTLVPALTVAFDANGGTGTMPDVLKASGTEYKLPACSFTAPAGNEFDCWEIDGTQYSGGRTITVNGNITVKAVWRVVWTITFDANGHGTSPASQTVENGCKASAPEAPTADGYAFGGWYKEAGCVNAWNFDSDTVTGNITLYAKWTATKYTITYNGTDGATFTTANPTKYTVETATFTLTNPTKTGYTFTGWTGTGLDGATTTVTITKGSTGDRTYTATWKNIEAFGYSDTYTPDGSESMPYVISNANGWDLLCEILQDNETWNPFNGKYFRLDGDITINSVNKLAGSSNHKFDGTFDGNGHIITLDIETSEKYSAPFRYTSGTTTIKTLKVTGSITTSANIAAGLVAEQNETLNIENCRVSVTINSAVNGPGYHGGLVAGNTSGATLNITNCVFDGKLLGERTSRCGGFVGNNIGTCNITNSLFAPSDVTITSSCSTFIKIGASSGTGNITNSYYTQKFGAAQGVQGYTVSAGDGITLTLDKDSAKGVNFDNKIYAGNDETVTLTITGGNTKEGYTFKGYKASAGTLTESEGKYSLTMPESNVTISAEYLELPYVSVNVTGDGAVTIGEQTATEGNPLTITTAEGESITLTFAPESGKAVSSVKYFYIAKNEDDVYGNLPISGTTATLVVPNDIKDGTGITMTVTFVSALFGGTDEASAVNLTDATVTNLAGGWYKVESDITFDHTLNLLSDTNLIIADSATMTVNTSSGNGIDSEYKLTVSGAGALSVTATGDEFCGIHVGNYVQTGGIVTVASDYAGIYCADDFYGSLTDSVTNDFTFSGGQLTVTIQGEEECVLGICVEDNIILDYTNADDFIEATSYGNDSDTVTVAAGKTFLTDDATPAEISGTVSVTTIHGKKLTPKGALVITISNGDVKAPAKAFSGDTVTLTYTGTVKTGYKVVFKVNGTEIEGNTFTMPDGAVEITAELTEIDYTITYNLDDGEVSTANPTKYTVETPTFTLNNPTKTGYTFAGWTGTGLTSATMTVTIEKGSTGERTYTATWTGGGSDPDPDAPTFTTHSLILEGELGMNFFMNLPSGVDYNDGKKYYMEFDINGDTKSNNPQEYDATFMNVTGKYYGFRCYVKSIQMADKITATFHYDGETVSHKYSVKEYLEYFLQQEQEQGTSTTLGKLAASILDYGHYVQPVLAETNGWEIGEDYAEIPCVNTYNDSDIAEATNGVNGKEIVRDTGNSGIEKVTFTLELDSDTTLDIFLVVPDDCRQSLSVTYNGGGRIGSFQPDGRYKVQISDIAAHQLGDTYTIGVSTSKGSFDIEVSALSYVHTVLNSTQYSDDMKKAVTALYKYYAATMAYRDDNN